MLSSASVTVPKQLFHVSFQTPSRRHFFSLLCAEATPANTSAARDSDDILTKDMAMTIMAFRASFIMTRQHS